MERRACNLCGQTLGRGCFSDFQWREGRLGKCIWCVRGHKAPSRPQRTAADRGLSMMHGAILPGKQEFTGLQKHAMGGDPAGPCVARWYRDAATYEDEGLPTALPDRGLLHNLLKISQKATRLIDEWNAMRFVDGVKLKLASSTPMQVTSGPRAGTHVLVEGRLPRNAQQVKFNSNSGWSLASQQESGEELTEEMRKISRVLDAFSHYSYHTTGGALALCNFTASWEVEPKHNTLVVTLSDVAILSRGSSYGPTDLGPDGLRHFFARLPLDSNPYCKGKHWSKPHDLQTIYLDGKAGSETLVERPMGLPPRVLPPGLGEGKAYATSRQQQKPSDDPLFEIEWGEAHHERKVMAMEAEAREAEERRKAADKVEQAEAWELQKKRLEEEYAMARAKFEEGFKGINGIDGIIGRRPTTQQPRKTVDGILFTDPQGWRQLTPLADLMKAPNDGTFYQEPAEEEGEAGGQAAAAE